MLSVIKDGLLCPRYGVFSNPEMMRKLISLYQEQKPWIEIAKELDVSYYLCQLIWKNYGIRNISYIKYNIIPVDEMHHKETKTVSNVCVAQVTAKKRKSIFSDDEKLTVLIAEYKSGKTYNQLAEIFGVSPKTCYNALKKAGAINKKKLKIGC